MAGLGLRRLSAVAGLTALLVAGACLAQTTAPAPPQAGTASPTVPAPARPPVYGYEVVNTYPHDPAAFTQGLEFHDGVLIESTGRHPSSVRRVRLEDGVVLEKKELPVEYFGEGLDQRAGAHRDHPVGSAAARASAARASASARSATPRA